MTPRATYRIQLHAGFTLEDARKRLPYFSALGVSHLYLSPITRAVPGSSHGYDVIDYDTVNPELGGEAALRQLADAAREHKLGLIADIVPNHMATHPANAWWWDVLARGKRSQWADYFDIRWDDGPDPAELTRILLPFLAEPYLRCLQDGKISITHEHGAYLVKVGDTPYPIADGSIPSDIGPDLLAHIEHDPSAHWREIDRILSQQHYRLADWRTAGHDINWRRFFDVSSLIGMRMEREAVFDDAHRLVLSLVGQGVLEGLRIDHVDGLAMPGEYLRRLRQGLSLAAFGRGQPYLVVEKILAPDETIDARWPVDGTTGYDFLDEVSGVLHDPASEPVLDTLWTQLGGDDTQALARTADARSLMLAEHFDVERRTLVHALETMLETVEDRAGWTTAELDHLISQWLLAFPVYRTYAEDGGPSAQDLQYVLAAHHGARPQLDASADALLDRILAHLYPTPETQASLTPAAKTACNAALIRLQQLTPPLAAKALEDTLFYRWGPLLSRNEVGASPTRPSMTPAAFHTASARRLQHYPHAMVTTATHDHKRGEDVRARLTALSEIPHEWGQLCEKWLQHWPEDQGQARVDRYMLLQTLVGAWPLALMPPSVHPSTDTDKNGQASDMQQWLARVEQWQLKALREAKVRTSWANPDLALEQALRHELLVLAQTREGQSLLGEIAAFAQALAPAGMINSLAQVLLRNTVPGMPDLYQGTDLWDFSLVDPDNRRAVDYDLREYMLHTKSTCSVDDPLHWREGRTKQTLLATLLNARSTHCACFTSGAYVPVEVSGPQADHIIAYVRQSKNGQVLAVAPRLCATRLAGYATGDRHSARSFWEDTVLHLPADTWAVPHLYNALEGTVLDMAQDRTIELGHLLSGWPVGLAWQTLP